MPDAVLAPLSEGIPLLHSHRRIEGGATNADDDAGP